MDNLLQKLWKRRKKVISNFEFLGISWHFERRKKYDSSTFHLPRQEVAFLKEARKTKGCGSLREDFYTKFRPKK